jgi:FkbH-like protein
MRYGPEALDYFSLMKRARRRTPTSTTDPVRVALLGDCALQQLRALLELLLEMSGVEATVFDAPFDTIDPQVLDPKSELNCFHPDFVVFVTSVQRVRLDLFLRASEPSEREGFADRVAANCAARWDAVLKQCNATILQTNLVLPLERPFGQFEHRVAQSTQSVLGAVNRRLVEEANARPSVFICDVEFVAASLGKSKWFDDRLWHLAKVPCALEHLPHFAQALGDLIAAQRGIQVKCVVLDLDNTLWGGVIGDDGLQGIRLGHLGEGEAFTAFQAFLKQLKQRGILLAICSKNEREAALLPFQQHAEMVLREDDISVFVANWQNKADNIRAIAAQLDIGLDSIVFIDDSPFERQLVRELVPQVIVPEIPEDPADYVRALCAQNLFETASYSELDGHRARLYRERAASTAVQATFSNVEDYLRSLEMSVSVGHFDALHLPRIVQLLQRSNQFNLTTRRYGHAQCEAFTRDDTHVTLFLSLKDKLSEHGIISVVILEALSPALHIDTFLMSCRVLSRGVEDFAMNTIFACARARGLSVVTGEYIPSPKNGMVSEFYSRFGFDRTAVESDGSVRFSLRVDDYRPREPFMRAEQQARPTL